MIHMLLMALFCVLPGVIGIDLLVSGVWWGVPFLVPMALYLAGTWWWFHRETVKDKEYYELTGEHRPL